MNLEMFVREAGTIFAIVLVVAGYVGFVIAFGRLVEYFFGWQASNRVVDIIGAPIFVVAAIVRLFWHTITWPWRVRNRRLFKEAFQITDGTFPEQNQSLVDVTLRDAASSLDEVFDRQEKERRLGVADPKTVKLVRYWKERFWELHRLAKKSGFSVRGRYSDYLIK